MYAAFNKNNEFMFFQEHKEQDGVYKYKDVGDIDPITDQYVGDYNHGKVIDSESDEAKKMSQEHLGDRPATSKSNVRLQTYDKINEKFDIYKQLNTMSEQIELIAQSVGCDQTDDFTQMRSHITSLRERFHRLDQFYREAEGIEYIEEDDEQLQQYTERLMDDQLLNKVKIK